MNIVQISKGIEEEKARGKMRSKRESWTPLKSENYEVPEFKLPKRRHESDVEKLMSKVLAFIDLNKKRRFNEGCTIMPIPVCNEELLKITKTHQASSRFIKEMVDMGLLEVEDDTWQFNAYYEEDNHCKMYRYYVENERKIEWYCKNNNIKKFLGEQVDVAVSRKQDITGIDTSAVLFDSNLSLSKPKECSKRQFEEYLQDCLYENYGWLAKYMKLADDINEKYYKETPELQVRFNVHFTWNRNGSGVRKIGIRATNQYAAKPKEEVCTAYSLNLHKDVRSSVPRITKSINKHGWVPEEIDIYHDVYNEYISRREAVDSELEVFSCEVREAIKNLFMRAYFDTAEHMGAHVWHKMSVASKGMTNKEENKQAVYQDMNILKEAVIEAEGGKLYGSEIFFHESCIYMDVLNNLLSEGYFVWQCYDAWYARKEGVSQAEFETYVTKLVEQCANDYINKYCK